MVDHKEDIEVDNNDFEKYEEFLVSEDVQALQEAFNKIEKKND
ncbi:hypothetical protein [Fictibacillus sp. JL2B1089]